MSLLEHTRERQPNHSERQARRSCNARADQRSHHGVWNFYRKHAERRANAHGKGIVTAKFNKNVVLIVTHAYLVLF